MNNDLPTWPIDAMEEVGQGEGLGVKPGEEVFHSSSVDKERTRLREEGVTGSNETDSLKILGLVSRLMYFGT